MEDDGYSRQIMACRGTTACGTPSLPFVVALHAPHAAAQREHAACVAGLERGAGANRESYLLLRAAGWPLLRRDAIERHFTIAGRLANLKGGCA